MPIRHLDHVTVGKANLDETVAWYEFVLGLQEGDRIRSYRDAFISSLSPRTQRKDISDEMH